MTHFPQQLLLLWRMRLFLTTIPVALLDGFFFYLNRPVFVWITLIWSLILLAGYSFYLPALYQQMQYQVTDKNVYLNTGLLFGRSKVILISNIQFLFISQTPFQRLLRLSSLRIMAAGGTIILPSLSNEKADQLLHQISARMELMDR